MVAKAKNWARWAPRLRDRGKEGKPKQPWTRQAEAALDEAMATDNPLLVPLNASSDEETARAEAAGTKVNLEAHEGLRGAAALWIMIFHCFRAYRGADIDFQGSSIMPLFFVLTGFTLAVVYNKTSPSETELQSGSILPSKRLTFWSFMNNRLVRVLPVYYLGSLIAIPAWFLGFGDQDPSDVFAMAGVYGTTATLTSTMFLFCLGSPLDGPSWTVQTFVWLWCTFPRFMQRARTMSSADLSKWISNLYWLQLVILLASFLGLYLLTPLGFWPSFCFATMHPLSRLPLFLMGIYAGELRVRSGSLSLLSVWPRAVACFFPTPLCACSCSLQSAKDGNGDGEVDAWTTRAFNRSLGLFAATLIVAGGNSLAGTNIVGAVWFQAIVPFCQLEIVLALTLQSTSSLLHRALAAPLARFLGKISMTIYLIHYSVIFYVEWGAYGFRSVVWPANAKRTAQNAKVSGPTDDSVYVEWEDARQLQLWAIPLVVGITIPIAAAVFYIFEEPVRTVFRV